MKSSVVATLLGLGATSFALANPDEATKLAKNDGGILVTLCNDFHGGKPCETHNVWPGQCSNVDANLYKYVSSVKIAQSDEYCTFYNGKNCKGNSIVVEYPGDVDLAVDDNFDNQIVSYSCAYDN